MILRDFCDFYAIFCQAKNLASQAPKTIIQAWGSPPIKEVWQKTTLFRDFVGTLPLFTVARLHVIRTTRCLQMVEAGWKKGQILQVFVLLV